MNPRGIHIAFDGIPGAEGEAVNRAVVFTASCGFSEERIADVKTAVEEACLNAIEHAVPDAADRSIHLRCSFVDGVLVIDIQYGGKPFVVPSRKPDIRAKIEGHELPRGWGLYLIRSLADSVEFDPKPDKTSVRMNFALKPVRKTTVRA